jgi:hypothetical protein
MQGAWLTLFRINACISTLHLYYVVLCTVLDCLLAGKESFATIGQCISADKNHAPPLVVTLEVGRLARRSAPSHRAGVRGVGAGELGQ